MRKIYINKRLVERVKTLRDLLSDVGSVHEFPLGDIPLGESLPAEGRRVAQLHIVPKGFSGFTYQVRRAPIGAPLLARHSWRATVGAPLLARHPSNSAPVGGAHGQCAPPEPSVCPLAYPDVACGPYLLSHS